MATETATPAAESQAPAAAAPAAETKPTTGTDPAKGASGEPKAPAAAPAAAKPPAPSAPTTLLGKKLPAAETAKPAAEAPKEGDKPKLEEYEVALPKDSLLGADQAKAMTEQYRKLGLTKDQAQALAEQTDGTLKTYVDTQVAKLSAIEAGWWQQLEANPKYGGSNLQESNKLATAALDKFFPGLRADLMESPYACHPALFPGLVELGKMIADPKFRTDGLPPKAKELSPAQKLYGEDGKGPAPRKDE